MKKMQSLNRIAVLAIWILCLLFNSAFAVPSNGDGGSDSPSPAPTPVEMICHPGKECYPKVFVPTTTFLPVEIDQVIPPGLHVRLNIGTGGREAKIIDPTEDEGTAVYVEKDKKAELQAGMEYSDLVVVPDQNIDQPSVLNPGLNSNETDAPPPVQHIPPEPENLKPNPHLTNSDWETFNNAASVLKESAPQAASLIEALQTLSDMSHEPEYGVKLIEISVQKLINIITSPEYASSIRSSAAITLGNSLQNNAVALSRVKKLFGTATKDVVLEPLLNALLKNQDMILNRRLMFALSRTVRIHNGKQDFVALNGLGALEKVYTATNDLPLRGKIAAFLQDEFLDMNMREMEVKSGVKTGSQNVIKSMDDLSGWCEIFQGDLVGRKNGDGNGDLDSEVKVLATLKALKEKYGKDCKPKPELKGWLGSEKERVKKEEDDGEWIKVPLDDVEHLFFGATA
ncbi:hypothetical protein TWF730_003372 [Orbilia blumenaviensis]|uniref:Nucleotide exchange factor SIL1 n=1 Tax=Orbilia blumenaviensis TaxID=1796055 RepID=A0AAV9U873_9PEZI